MRTGTSEPSTRRISCHLPGRREVAAAVARTAAGRLLIAGALWMLALAIAQPLRAQEQIDIEVPNQVVVDLNLLPGAGSVPAREASQLTFVNARLAAGKALRIGVRLDSPAPPGLQVSFEGRNAQGGMCAGGRLAPASFVQVFQSAAGAGAGGCELHWSVTPTSTFRRASRWTMTLRWQLDSVIVDPKAAHAAGSKVSGGSPGLASGKERRIEPQVPAGPAPGPPFAASRPHFRLKTRCVRERPCISRRPVSVGRDPAGHGRPQLYLNTCDSYPGAWTGRLDSTPRRVMRGAPRTADRSSGRAGAAAEEGRIP